MIWRPITASPSFPETSPFLTQMKSSCSLVSRIKLLGIEKLRASTSGCTALWGKENILLSCVSTTTAFTDQNVTNRKNKTKRQNKNKIPAL